MTAPLPGTELPASTVRSLSCPRCGAAIALRAAGWSETVACDACGAVLDAADPNLRVLRAVDQQSRVRPRIPLGTRGTLPAWAGVPYEVVGFQVREIRVEATNYRWREYVCFNPYHGFRYLTEYDGHWSDVVPISALVPEASQGTGPPVARWEGGTYRHFQTARARTTYVLGEFPWEARTDDVVEVRDYVAPPRMLSREHERDEVTWSLGTYVAAADVWRGFALPGSAPPPHGVYASQPSPWRDRLASTWRWFAGFAIATVVLVLVRLATAANAQVFEGAYRYDPDRASEEAFVTPSFTLPGGRGNVVLETRAQLDNQWMYVDYALVNEATGQLAGVGRELGYYEGYDSDGRWTDGSRRDRVTLGPVPGGRYFLRVEPAGGDLGRGPIDWALTVRRDTPSVGLLLLALVALAVPPIVVSALAASFETRRWAESDHAPSASITDDEEEED